MLRDDPGPSAAALTVSFPRRTWGSGWLWSRSWGCWRRLRLPRLLVWLCQALTPMLVGGVSVGGLGCSVGAVPTGCSGRDWAAQRRLAGGVPLGAADPSPGQGAPPCLTGERAGGSLHCAQARLAQELRAISGCCCAWGHWPWLSQVCWPCSMCGRLCPCGAPGDASCLLSASQNNYRIDPNQELLAMGKRLLGEGGQGVGCCGAEGMDTHRKSV